MFDDKLIKVIKFGVKKINENKDIVNWFREKCAGEKRTSVFKVIDKRGNIYIGGFAFDGEKFIFIEKGTEIKNPTVVLKTTEDITWALILGKMDLSSAIFLGKVEVEGNYWLRDITIFTKAFEEFRNVLHSLF